MENSSAGQGRYDMNAEDGFKHILNLALDVQLYVILCLHDSSLNKWSLTVIIY